ncbi:hypothetical protein LJC43_08220, partial [Parabacteroides sp. OttesenSCG-928-G21]|nr:hypothetical protein [Parabacteroides sp. OttesenSCG-928-G21]
MNKTFLSMTMATMLLTASCGQQNKENEADLPLIGPADMVIPDGKMTPEVLYSMARVSDARLSPDGGKVL